MPFLGCQMLLLSAPQEIDEYELVDPVDILTPLEKSGFWDGVVSFCPFYQILLSSYCTFTFVTGFESVSVCCLLSVLLIFRKPPNGLKGRKLLLS